MCSFNNRIDCISKDACTGCKVCKDICPTNAIEFCRDDEGFWYPHITVDQCINCGKCYRICPVGGEKQGVDYAPIETYAAWSKDDDMRRQATSGGLFPVFGDYILSVNGCIVGSAYTNDYRNAYHMIVDSEKGYQRLKGSKYFQSDTEGIYERTKQVIDSGKEVLFVGTPCQVAALYGFLGGRPKNLTTIDFICRGVSSPLLQEKKIEYYEKKEHSKVTLYRDKYKKYAWIDFGVRICFENGKERFISRWKDEILHFFIKKNFNIRSSCYRCGYKLGHMQSDITIGDFWGIDRVTEKDLRDGVSALMINTERGVDFLSLVRNKLYLCRKPLERVKKGNPAYSCSPDFPEERKDFFYTVKESGWEEAIKRYKKYSAETTRQKKKHDRRMKRRPYLQLWHDRKEIRWKDFIYYNYRCKSVIREPRAFIIPYRGALIEIHNDAKLYIKGNLCVNYTPYYPRGKQIATLQIRKGAEVHFDNRIEIGYGAMLSVGEDAYLKSGYLMLRLGTSLVCKRKMNIGNNVLIGRDACIYDSDYHTIYDDKFQQTNPDKSVSIGDNVWMGARVLVLKGSRIGNDSVIAAGTIVSGEVNNNLVYAKKNKNEYVSEITCWEQ